MMPGLVLLSAIGDRLAQMWSDPTPREVVLPAGLILVWIVAAIGANLLVTRLVPERR
jgi:hypothetical protein